MGNNLNNELLFFTACKILNIFWVRVCLGSPELTNVLQWMFSFDSTFLSQLCVDILKSCRADNKKKIFFKLNFRLMQIWIINACLLVYPPGLGLVGLWENCWAESRNMTSSEETDKREVWSEKSSRSKPVRNTSLFVCIYSMFIWFFFRVSYEWNLRI